MVIEEFFVCHSGGLLKILVPTTDFSESRMGLIIGNHHSELRLSFYPGVAVINQIVAWWEVFKCFLEFVTQLWHEDGVTAHMEVSWSRGDLVYSAHTYNNRELNCHRHLGDHRYLVMAWGVASRTGRQVHLALADVLGGTCGKFKSVRLHTVDAVFEHSTYQNKTAV